MAYQFEGSKYQETKDIYGSELVKLIKKELKEKFPDHKVLASKETYAGGWTIHITLKNTGLNRWSDDPAEKEKYKQLYDKVKDIVQQYNFDDSDSMSDYYHVKFHSHIRLEE